MSIYSSELEQEAVDNGGYDTSDNGGQQELDFGDDGGGEEVEEEEEEESGGNAAQDDDGNGGDDEDGGKEDDNGQQELNFGGEEANGGEPTNDGTSDEPAPQKKSLKQKAGEAGAAVKEIGLKLFSEFWLFIKTAGRAIKDGIVAKIKQVIETITEIMTWASGLLPALWAKIQKGLSFMLGSNPAKKTIDIILDILNGTILQAILAPIQELFKAVAATVKPLFDMAINAFRKAKAVVEKVKGKFPELWKLVSGGGGTPKLAGAAA